MHYVYNSLQYLNQVVKWVIHYYIEQNFWNAFFFGNYIELDWIKDNALKSFGECIALLWLIETVNYLLMLLLSEWTIFSIAGNMCSKDLDEQYASDIAGFFRYCIVLHFNVSFANALHLLYFVWCIRPKYPKQFSLPCNSYWKFLQTVMQVNAFNYVHQNVCKVKAHLSAIICGSWKTYFKGECSLKTNIHHD